MSNKHAKSGSTVGPILFPKRREMSTQLGRLENDIRTLRDKIENEKDVISVARSAALLYVDFIARVHTFAAQLDTELGGQLFVPGYPFKQNLRRAKVALAMFNRLWQMVKEAIEGVFRCLGGEEVIAFQASARGAAQESEAGRTNSVRNEQIQSIQSTLMKQLK